MATISKSDFIKCVQKSRVIEPEQFKKWLGVFENGAEPDSVLKLASNLVRDQLLTKWQAKYLLSGRSRLDIGSYRLLERISRDKLGDRFMAVQTSLARKVDIQVLPGDLTKDKDSCAEFMQKASLAAKLDHPNLIHVYDIDREGGRIFLVTEHVDGTTLEKTARTKLSQDDVARVVNSALKGMCYAHQNDVVHGQITPSDLVLTTDDEVKIQNLTLSPLRQQLDEKDSGVSGCISQESDFLAIANIGQTLLTEVLVSKKTEVDEKLAGLLSAINPADAESIQLSIDAIDGWRMENGNVVEPDSEDPFSGGFDNPISTTAVRQIKSKPTEEKAESEEEEELATPGFFGQLWSKNPVGVIATSAVLGLMLIGGSVYAGMALLGNGGNVAQTKLAPESNRNSSNSKITKTTSERRPVHSPKILPNPKDKPPVFSPEEMKQFTATVNGNKNSDIKPDNPTVPKEDQPPVGNQPLANQPIGNANQPGQPKTTDTQPGIAQNDPSQNGVTKNGDTVNTTNTAATNTPAASTTPTTPAVEKPDELSFITGIGAKTRDRLYEVDIKTFKKLASMSPDQIKAALQAISYVFPSQDYESWITQSKARIGDTSQISTAGAPDAAMTGMTQQAVDPSSPFAKFPRVVGLPPADSTAEKKIGDLAIKRQYLLAGEIICEEGFAKGKLVFEMTRTPDDKQKWFVGYKRRAKDELTNVGMIRKSEDAVFFQWLPEAAESKYANSLRNCFLKLKLPDDVNAVITLREPIKFSDLRLTTESLQNRVIIDIPHLPMPENIIVEMAPVRISGQDIRMISSLITPNQPAKFQLKQSDTTGFLYVQVAADFRREFRLQSNLMLIVDGKHVPIASTKALGELANGLQQKATAAFAIHNQKKDVVAPYGKKGEYDDVKKGLLKQANDAQEAVEKMNQYGAILEKVMNQPINVSVYSKLGRFPRVLLAVSDPTLFEELSKKGKKKK